MRYHIVDVWRSQATGDWHHRFSHSNGREQSRQSEGIGKRDRALRSAGLAYNLGTLTPSAYAGDYVEFSCERRDVLVRVWTRPGGGPR